MQINSKLVEKASQYIENPVSRGLKLFGAGKPHLLEGIKPSELKLAPLEKDCFQKTEKMYFDRSELPEIKAKWQKFYEGKIIPMVKPELPPDLKLLSEIEGLDEIPGHAISSPLGNMVIFDDKLLFDENFYKLIDKTTGKWLLDKNVKWQIQGDSYALDYIIKEQNLTNAKKAIMNKQERLDMLLSNTIHETDHTRQTCNQLMHEDIGPEKYFDNILNKIKIGLKEQGEDLSNEDATAIKGGLYETFQSVINNGKKIKRNTRLGKKTMNQYNDMNEISRTKNESDRYIQLYELSSHERETYRRELYFAKELGIHHE